MIYTFLISIVFIAQIIIAITLFQWLLRVDKRVLNLDNYISNNKTKFKEISSLVNKISGQAVILSENLIVETKEKLEDFALQKLSKILVALLVLSLNFKIIKKIRKSKITKTLVKGFSFLENMV